MSLGNSDDAERNLYCGAAFGARTFLRKSEEWKEIALAKNPSEAVLGRPMFGNAKANVYLIADAYRGREIRKAIAGFYWAAAGHGEPAEQIRPRAAQAYAK